MGGESEDILSRTLLTTTTTWVNEDPKAVEVLEMDPAANHSIIT
jgi:hypothetical protein